MSNLQNVIKGFASDAEYQSKKRQTDLLVKKWQSTGLLKNLKEQTARNMARMLTNEAFELKKLNEDSYVSAIAGFNKIAFPLVRRSFGRLLANEIVSVQPMSQPSGLIFYIDYKYDRNKADSGTSDGSVFGTRDTVTNPALQGVGGQTGQGGLYNLGNSYSRRMYRLSTSAPANSGVTAQSTYLNATVSGYDFTLASYAATDLSALWAMRVALSSELGFDTQQASFRGLLALTGLTAFTLASVVDPTLTELTSGSAVRVFSSTNLAAASASGTATNVLVGNASTIVTNPPQSTLLGDFEAVNEIPQINISMQTVTVFAETRQLKAVWTPQLAQDMAAYADVDPEVELTTTLSEYITIEIDNQIITELLNGAAVKAAWSAQPGKQLRRNADGTISTVSFTDGSYGTGMLGAFDYSGWYSTLVQTINHVSNEILKRNQKWPANFIITSTAIASLLESVNGFKGMYSTDNENLQFSLGVQKVGELQGKYTVYKNTYFPSDMVLIGAKGPGFSDSGYVYAPYVPLIVTPTIFHQDNFTPRKGVMTRGASQMIRPEFYGVIKVYNLDAVQGFIVS